MVASAMAVRTSGQDLDGSGFFRLNFMICLVFDGFYFGWRGNSPHVEHLHADCDEPVQNV